MLNKMMLSVCLVLALSACQKQPTTTVSESPVTTPSTTTADTPMIDQSPASAWVGRWDGQDGSYLDVTAERGHYVVVIRNLDGEQVFLAAPNKAGLSFSRQGEALFLKVADQQASQVPWAKADQMCLMVKQGEGYCRG